MGAGRVFALIGALVGLSCLLLSLILPELLCWYKYEGFSAGLTAGWYLTGFGTIINRGPIGPLDNSIVVLIGGIVVIVGAVILCIGSAAMERKTAGLIGGILMLLGPILVIADLLIGISELAENMKLLVDGVGGIIFWGTFDTGLIVHSWSLWIGFYIILVGGFLGLVGGVAV